VLIAGAAAAAVVWLWPLAETTAPTITLEPALDYIPAHVALKVNVQERGSGLREVVVSISQGQHTFVLAKREFPPAALLEKGPGTLALELEISPLKLGLVDGPATIEVMARDRALYNWGEGNITRIERKVVVDTTAPKLNVLNGVVYMSRGGSAAAVYTCEGAVASGVSVGKWQFLGREWKAGGKLKLCLFAWPLEVPSGTQVWVWARDAAGNTTRLPLAVRLRPLKAPLFKIRLNDNLLKRLVQRMASHLPPGLASRLPTAFKWINEQLRKANHQQIRAVTSQAPTPRRWKGALLRPPGATTALFGERRVYIYGGEVLTRSVHLGVDLAHTSHCIIKAAGAGRIIFAGPLGIYGNCVIVDHGLGLATLYGHLWQITVKEGQQIHRGQPIGRSDSTGLALGDHLHFSVLVGGVFVNPREWWDPSWVQAHVLAPAGASTGER